VENIGDYFARRAREDLNRAARHQEWDYQATALSADEIAGHVGPGWRPLARQLHHDLRCLDPHYRLFQVKEKLGRLRFYADFAGPFTSECHRRVAAAVAKAAKTCEVCGGEGRLRTRRPWLETLCDACWAADRAAADERGERYAAIVLSYLLSGDPHHPTPDEIIEWLGGREP
jgi:hypothetical protein